MKFGGSPLWSSFWWSKRNKKKKKIHDNEVSGTNQVEHEAINRLYTITDQTDIMRIDARRIRWRYKLALVSDLS